VSAHDPRRVLYVLKRFPRVSETFILREMLSLEASGLQLGVDSLLAAEGGVRHRELAHLRAEVRYLPKHPRVMSRAVFGAHLHVAFRTPVVWSRLARNARRDGRWDRFLHAGLTAARARRMGADVIHATASAEVARTRQRSPACRSPDGGRARAVDWRAAPSSPMP
jgi:hypothetical protein